MAEQRDKGKEKYREGKKPSVTMKWLDQIEDMGLSKNEKNNKKQIHNII